MMLYLSITKNLSRTSLYVRRLSTKNVAIIGAGVAGLQVCSSLKTAGLNCTLFERNNDIGGVWRDNYSNMKSQAPRELYEYPDYEMTSVSSNVLAKSQDVQSYIKQFCTKMKLFENIVLNASVEKIKKNSNNSGWDLSYSTAPGEQKSLSFDYVIICTGMYSSYLNIPAYSGDIEFKNSGGEILHSSQCTFQKVQSFKDKNVVIIGSAKSAQDVSAEAILTGNAKSSTLLFRHAHWGTPLFIAGVIPFQYVFLSRFGQSLVSMYKGVWPGISTVQEYLHKIISPVMHPIFKIVETIFAYQLKQYGLWKPDMDVVKDFYGYGHLPSTSFINCMKKGFVNLMKDEIASLNKDKSITLKSGRTIPCDVVVLGTGFKKCYDMFEDDIKDKLDVQSDCLYLYRHMIPPKVDNIAFIGSEIATISNIATYTIQSTWIKNLLTNKIKLPSIENMIHEVENIKSWKRSWMPYTPSRANLVLLHQIHYHDILLKDMNTNPYRKGWNIVSEIFMPYRPRDYKNL